MKFKDIFRFRPRASREEFALIGACCQVLALAGTLITQEFMPHLLSSGFAGRCFFERSDIARVVLGMAGHIYTPSARF